MSKYYLAVNPHGGVKKGLGILEQVKPVFEKAGAEINILETEYAGHARNMARTVDIDGYDGFCAIGGDGTMHEIINGMMNREDGQKITNRTSYRRDRKFLMHDWIVLIL